MVTKSKTPAKKIVKAAAVAVKKITNTTVQKPVTVDSVKNLFKRIPGCEVIETPKPVAKALTIKAPARTPAQEKTVTKAIETLKKSPVVIAPKTVKATEKRLDVVMKKTQVVMKKEIAKAAARTPAQEKVITTVIKDLKTAKKTLATDIKKVVKSLPTVNTSINKVATKDLLKNMEDYIAKAVS